MNSITPPTPKTPPKLLDQVRDRLRLKRYSIRTETQYIQWVRRFIMFHDKRHPREMGVWEVEAFLTHLAVEGNMAAATQNQALSALLFRYREVLEIDLPWLDNVVRAKRPARLPVVLTRNEVTALLGRMEGTHALMARLWLVLLPIKILLEAINLVHPLMQDGDDTNIAIREPTPIDVVSFMTKVITIDAEFGWNGA